MYHMESLLLHLDANVRVLEKLASLKDNGDTVFFVYFPLNQVFICHTRRGNYL